MIESHILLLQSQHFHPFPHIFRTSPCLCIRFSHVFTVFFPRHTSATPWAKVGMVIAAVAASFGFHPGLDQTIFMARLGSAGGRGGRA